MRRSVILAAAVVCSIGPAWAVDRPPALAIAPLGLSPAGEGSLVVGAADAPTKGTLRFSASLDYQHDALVAYDAQTNTRVGAVVGNRLMLQLGALYAPHPRVALQLVLPIVGYQNGDDLQSRGFSSPSTAGLGMPALSARFSVLDEKSFNVALSGQLGFELPLGSSSALAGEDFGFVPRVLASRHLGPVWLCADLAMRFRPPVKIGAKTLETELLAGLSAATTGSGVRGELSVVARVPLTGFPAAVNLLAGGRVPVGGAGFELFAVVGPGLGAMPGNPDFRFLAGAAFVPKM